MDDIYRVEVTKELEPLLEHVRRGDAVELTRNGETVARLVSLAPKKDRAAAIAAAQRLRELSKGQSLGGISIRELIDEGRKY